MPEVNYSEKCPKCERSYPVPKAKDYFKQERIEGKGRVVAPNDIACQCGLTIRWIVPIFKITDSGFQLVPKKDSEPLRNSTEK